MRLAPRFGVTPLPLTPSVGQHASGFNASLTRPPACEAVSLPLPMCEVAAKLRPDRPKVMCVKLTFSAGFEFIPPREKAAKPPRPSAVLPDETAAIEAAEGAILDEVEVRPKRTRLKPPPGTLSLQDRLFYVLQPPLEDWLAGQELVMPFEPFPYQYEGIAWLFSRDAALLADEMGLGKTMQTITGMRLLLRSGQARRVLLICPKPLIPNWQREFALWAPELPVTTIEGPTEKRKLLWDMPGVGIYLVNYEAATRDLDRGESGEEPTARGPQGPAFDLLVLDEAQRIKNRDSRTARVARDINCGRAWALTGTPIENRPDELVSLFEFLQVVPPRAAPDLAQLRSLSEANILRRTKDLVMTDMPPRIDQDELLELTPGQQAAYHHAEKEGVVQLNEMGDTATVQHVFELVLRLKQISNYDPATGTSCKVDRLCADMEEIAASGGKAILFSQWTKTIDWIDTRVREAVPHSNPLIYHGGVPTKQREPILQRFKEDPRA
ncbi:MAG: DEAD/DEAH box helicase, partial [Planctomycetota bacterium]